MRFAFRHRWHRRYYDYDYDRGYYGDDYDGGYYSPWNDWQSRTWAMQSYYGD